MKKKELVATNLKKTRRSWNQIGITEKVGIKSGRHCQVTAVWDVLPSFQDMNKARLMTTSVLLMSAIGCQL